ncbi:MAG: sn-glycerol-3-phosphate ABC transporter ATP-binding protein UgpC [Hyphomicrobiales bacterium]
MAGLELRGIEKAFGDVKVIHGVDLDIDDGEFVVFVGPSGCGKSTLLRLVSGLEDTTGGVLKIGERDVTTVEPAERGVAMVFQSYALYPHMTVEENMGFGLKMTGHSKEEVDERVSKAATILKLDHMLDRKPKAMSGGQRQRVAIGRAIVREPEVFLFDEPLSNLDAELRVEMRLEIAKLHQDLGNTMIYVTHDQTEAMTLADKIVVLRAGNIEQVGSPIHLYTDPDNLFVAGFIGSPRMNFFEVQVDSVSGKNVVVTGGPFGSQKVTVTARDNMPKAGDTVHFGVRPEHFVSVAESGATIEGKVNVVEQLGGASFLYIDIGRDEPLTVEQKGITQEKQGHNAKIGVDPSTCMLFDKNERRI